MSKKHISIAHDFSETPAGRYQSDGPFSGERFRDTYLLPALRKHETVEVDLDGTLGYGSSFLEEAFGGLIREHNFEFDVLQKKLHIKSSRNLYRERIWHYLEDAERQKKKGKDARR